MKRARKNDVGVPQAMKPRTLGNSWSQFPWARTATVAHPDLPPFKGRWPVVRTIRKLHNGAANAVIAPVSASTRAPAALLARLVQDAADLLAELHRASDARMAAVRPPDVEPRST